MGIDDDYLKSRRNMFKNKTRRFEHTNSGVFDCNVTRIGLEKDECIIDENFFVLTLMILAYLDHRLLEILLLL